MRIYFTRHQHDTERTHNHRQVFCYYCSLSVWHNNQRKLCWKISTHSDFSPNQGRIQEFLIGGSKLWFAKDCSTFLCQITFPPHPLPPVAEKAEMTMSFSICELFWRVLISLEFSLVAKCNTHFIEKNSQLKRDIRSCRCKNFSLKQASGLIGVCLDPPDPLPGSATEALLG